MAASFGGIGHFPTLNTAVAQHLSGSGTYGNTPTQGSSIFGVPNNAEMEQMRSDLAAQGMGPASNILAHIHREQWQDWKERFAPRLIDLAGYATSGSLTRGDITRADRAVQASFSQARSNENLRQKDLGLRSNIPKGMARVRSFALGENAARASARNQARVSGQDRDMQILAGSGGIGLDRLRGEN